MNDLEYQIIVADNVTDFNTSIKTLYLSGWCSNNNIVVAADGKIYQEWCRSLAYAKET